MPKVTINEHNQSFSREDYIGRPR